MCESGVGEVITGLATTGVASLDSGVWESIADGFSPRSSRTGEPSLTELSCPQCPGKVPIVRRTLISGAYNLPDAVVYQRLKRGVPAIALGVVDPGPSRTTMSRRPGDRVREAWQSLMWEVYHVALVDVEHGRLGQFIPRASWEVGQPIPDFRGLIHKLQAVMDKARRNGEIPQRNSPLTCQALTPVIEPVLKSHGFHFDGFERGSPAFWWWHPVDMLFRLEDGRGTLAIEGKVDEDWEHPINQPLAALLGHNAVINVRIPTHADRLDSETRRLVDQAEALLAATDRAAFMVVR